MFERFRNENKRESPELSDESDEDEESSDDDEEGFGRPMSVHDIRKEMRPGTAASSGKRSSSEQSTTLPRHTII